MPSAFVYKTYTTTGSPESVRQNLTEHFLSHGLERTGSSTSGAVTSFRYPSLLFSSKRPLTCVSDVSLEALGNGGTVRVRIGATFTKIKYFTIFIMAFIWIGLPILLGVLQGTIPEFSPFGCLVVPAGFLTHYMVRGRVFRYMRVSVERAGMGSPHVRAHAG